VNGPKDEHLFDLWWIITILCKPVPSQEALEREGGVDPLCLRRLEDDARMLKFLLAKHAACCGDRLFEHDFVWEGRMDARYEQRDKPWRFQKPSRSRHRPLVETVKPPRTRVSA
jgi:hypothetical protein